MIRKQRVRTEEELTISLFKLLKGSPQFKKQFIGRIYQNLQEHNIKSEDFRNYDYNVISEVMEKNVKDEICQFDLHFIGKRSNGTEFHILVENKIGDQIHLDQMRKYAKYSDKNNNVIVTITKTGTCYEEKSRAKLQGLVDGHLYWNDIIKLLQEFNITSKIAENQKKEVLEKLKELSCEFYDYPPCLNKFKSSFDNSKNNIKKQRDQLKGYSDKIFIDSNILKDIKIDYINKIGRNTPSNQLSYEYTYYFDKIKLIGENSAMIPSIPSIIIWINFGEKISSLYEDIFTFEQPSIQIYLPLPEEIDKQNQQELLDLHTKIKEKYQNNVRDNKSNDILSKEIPMVNFARDCKDLEELFLAIKKEFISTINEWKKTGIFNEINNEFLKSMVD